MVIVRVEKTWLNVINHTLTKTGQGYHLDQSVSTLNLNNHGYLDVCSQKYRLSCTNFFKILRFIFRMITVPQLFIHIASR